MKRPYAVFPQRSGLDAAVKDKQLGILDLKEARQWSDRLVRPGRSRVVCRFWLEKAMIVWDCGQIYGLMWQLSQPWPWPSRWLRATRWVNAFNLDVLSFLPTGAAMGATSQSFSLWGEMRLYWVYALFWVLLPVLGLATTRISKRRWERQGRADAIVRGLIVENVLLQIYQVLYLPIGLAALRLVNCDASNHVSVDPTSFSGGCWSVGHVFAVIFITCVLGGGFLLGFPWLLYRRTTQWLVHYDTDAHERFVVGKELEYILGTSDAYMDLYMPQYASFRRSTATCATQTCLVKLLLILIFSVLRSPAPSNTNQGAQGTLFFTVLLFAACKHSYKPPYRQGTSNLWLKITEWLLVANGVFVLLCSNGVRSALTVSTAVTSSLTFVNLGILIPSSLVVIQSARMWQRRTELIIRENQVYATSPCWSTHTLMREIVCVPSIISEWIAVIHLAQEVATRTLIAAPSMRPYQELADHMAQLQGCLEQASVLDHPLNDQLYALILHINDLYVESFAASPFRLGAPDDEAFSSLTNALQQRDDALVITSFQKRRVLLKLHTTHIWSEPTTADDSQPPLLTTT